MDNTTSSFLHLLDSAGIVMSIHQQTHSHPTPKSGLEQESFRLDRLDIQSEMHQAPTTGKNTEKDIYSSCPPSPASTLRKARQWHRNTAAPQHRSCQAGRKAGLYLQC